MTNVIIMRTSLCWALRLASALAVGGAFAAAKLDVQRVRSSRAGSPVRDEESSFLSKSLTKRLLEQQQIFVDTSLATAERSSEAGRDASRSLRVLATSSSSSSGSSGSTEACDSAFVNQCLTNSGCVECFLEMETKDIDWASVSPDTPCTEVVGFLQKGGYCKRLANSQSNADAFCKTFSVCVVWTDQIDDDHPSSHNYDEPDGYPIDCDKLTECKWDGMRVGYLGNAICNLEECYNTAICNYDGGDCCKDTCSAPSSLVECGHDGYFCLDPNSTNCNPTLTKKCASKGSDGGGGSSTKPKPECASTDSLWAVKMYDSWGDGWDGTSLKITRTTGSSLEVFSGALGSGGQGTEYVCLSKSPTCYRVEAKGGMWGKEVSWEVKPLAEGAPAIAGGGSPMDCNFAVGGADSCGTACTGKPNIDPSKDPEYKQFKDMFNCIESKCLIQANACNQDAVCKKCFQDDPQDYCFGNDVFNALIDCSICKCSKGQTSDFCSNKGKDFVPASGGSGSATGTKRPCTPSETVSGGSSVISFSKCIDFEQVTMLIPDYDTNNFGPLDKFEACAHAYNTPDHSGHTALSCLQILANAALGSGFSEDTKAPKEAIMALAKSLYQDGESFCNCTKDASDKCPLCSSFMNFKTLLYESLDACQALDEIDCDAWSEFSDPCKAKLESTYKSIDFSKAEQCDYVKNGCGGTGPFPAFRRLDCDKEVSAASWSFYQTFASKCLKSSGGGGSAPKPAPVPVPSPTAPNTSPTKPYLPTDDSSTPRDSGKSPSDSGGGKPYVPPEENGSKKSYTPSSDRRTSSGWRWFWNLFWICTIVGLGYYAYKRRADGFSFIRYRRMRNAGGSSFGYYGGDGSDMYTGLSLESSTSFEPPRLPPTPAAMGSMGYQ